MVEFRIPLPFYLEDAEIALRYALLKKLEFGGAVVDLGEPKAYEDSETSDDRLEDATERRRTWRFAHHVPSVLGVFLDQGAFEIQEIELDAYPYSKISFSSGFFAERLKQFELQTMVIENDRGQNPNAFLENMDFLDEVELVFIDISEDKVSAGSFWESEDSDNDLKPAFYRDCDPVCSLYVLVKLDFEILLGKELIEDTLIDWIIRDRLIGMCRGAWSLREEWKDLTHRDLDEMEAKIRECSPPLAVEEEGVVEAVVPEVVTISSPRNVTRVELEALEPELRNEIRRMTIGPKAEQTNDWMQWISEPFVYRKWSTMTNDDPLDEDERPLSLALTSIKGYNVELGSSEVGEMDFSLVEPLGRTAFYGKVFADALPHVHFLGTAISGEKFFVTVEALLDPDRTVPLLALVFMKRNTKRAVQRAPNGIQVQLPENVEDLNSFLNLTYPGCSLQRVDNVAAHDLVSQRLVEFENMHLDFDRRVGILYWKSGQSEDQAFSNQMSPEFDEFLNFFGERIRLKGWQKFRGGLNVTMDETGEHSVFTEHKEFNLMAHVSALLPFREQDVQKLDRKRHIGNDLVVIIFWEGPGSFDPSQLVTQMCHVFIVVERVEGEEELQYRVAVVCKSGVDPFPPFVPIPAIFTANASFHEWLITKIINAERAAFQAKTFLIKTRTARRLTLDKLFQESSEQLTDNAEYSDPLPWRIMLTKQRARRKVTVSSPQNCRKIAVSDLASSDLVKEIQLATERLRVDTESADIGDDDTPPPISPRDDHDLWENEVREEELVDDYDKKPVPPIPAQIAARPLPELRKLPVRSNSVVSPRSPRGSTMVSASIPLGRKSTGDVSSPRELSPRRASSPRNKSLGRSASPPPPHQSGVSPRSSPRRTALTLPPEATPPAPPPPAPVSLNASPRARSSTLIADDLIDGMSRLKPSPPPSPRSSKAPDDDDLFGLLYSRVSSVRSAISGKEDEEKASSSDEDEFWE